MAIPWEQIMGLGMSEDGGITPKCIQFCLFKFGENLVMICIGWAMGFQNVPYFQTRPYIGKCSGIPLPHSKQRLPCTSQKDLICLAFKMGESSKTDGLDYQRLHEMRSC